MQQIFLIFVYYSRGPVAKVGVGSGGLEGWSPTIKGVENRKGYRKQEKTINDNRTEEKMREEKRR
jgi:hypothetical protein